mgnify:FL=1
MLSAQCSPPTARPDEFLRIEVGGEVLFGNESTGLANNGAQRAGIEFGMEWDGEDLPPLCPSTNQLDVAASLRDLLETESLKDCGDITTCESPQFRHGRDPIPW